MLSLGGRESEGWYCGFRYGNDEESGACQVGTLEKSHDILRELVLDEGGKTEKKPEVGEVGNMEKKTLTPGSK
jgi:hypothetical protein